MRSRLFFWLWSAMCGEFRTPPAIRMHGAVGAARAAMEDELRQRLRRFGKLRAARGYQVMWANMRDVRFIRADAIRIGAMTRDCWTAFDDSTREAAGA